MLKQTLKNSIRPYYHFFKNLWKKFCRIALKLKSHSSILDEKGIYDRTARITLKVFLGTRQFLNFPQIAQPEISIIIILFNQAPLTLGCLRSLLEAAGAGLFELILIDNDSKDLTDLLLNQIRGVTVIRNKENVGFLLACNQAAQLARGDYLLFLNNDTLVLPAAIETALKTLKSSKEIGAVGARIINMNGRLQEAGSVVWKDGSCQGYGRGHDPFQSEYMFRRDVDYCSGAFLLTPRLLFEAMGGFNKNYVPAYYEETDYCFRLRQQGFRIIYEPDAVIFHYEFGSSSSSAQTIAWMTAHQKIFLNTHQNELRTRTLQSSEGLLHARVPSPQKLKLLFIEDRAPHPSLGAGFPRAHEILKAMVELNFFVTLYPTLVPNEEWWSIYQDIPREVEVIRGHEDDLLEKFLASRLNYYQVIVVSRPHNMKLLQPILKKRPEWFDKVKLVYDAEAIFSFRNRALAQLLGNSSSEASFQKAIREEMMLAKYANTVCSVSEQEKNQFEKFGLTNVHVLSHSLQLKPTAFSFSERKNFLFVGAIHYHRSPNSDSVLWFAQEVFPLILSKLNGGIKFLIVGWNLSKEVSSLQSDSIRVLGKVECLTEFYNQCRVFVAPTRFSAGVPLKAYEASSYGIPIVATSLIAEQLNWQHEKELLCAPFSHPNRFADECVRLYENSNLWNQVREEALIRIGHDCSPIQFKTTVAKILSFPRESPEEKKISTFSLCI